MIKQIVMVPIDYFHLSLSLYIYIYGDHSQTLPFKFSLQNCENFGVA